MPDGTRYFVASVEAEDLDDALDALQHDINTCPVVEFVGGVSVVCYTDRDGVLMFIACQAVLLGQPEE